MLDDTLIYQTYLSIPNISTLKKQVHHVALSKNMKNFKFNIFTKRQIFISFTIDQNINMSERKSNTYKGRINLLFVITCLIVMITLINSTKSEDSIPRKEEKLPTNSLILLPFKIAPRSRESLTTSSIFTLIQLIRDKLDKT